MLIALHVRRSCNRRPAMLQSCESGRPVPHARVDVDALAPRPRSAASKAKSASTRSRAPSTPPTPASTRSSRSASSSPQSRDDIVRTVQICREHRCPLTMRGGGTSQAGQAIGAGLIVDTSKYFNRLLEVNVEERWARVEPGIVLDELNAALRPHGLRFAPDISTASRATIGGMMANNSSGARSVLYGKTIDHVLEQHVVLSDGSVAHFAAARRRASSTRRARGDSLEAACYREVRRLARALRRRNRAALSEGPAARRRLQPRRVRRRRRSRSTWRKLMVGSEGTLGVVARGEDQPGAAAEGQGGAGDPVRRPARGARGDAGDPRARPVGGRGDGPLHPRPHQAEPGARPRCGRRSSRAIRARCCASSSTPIAPRTCRRGWTALERDLRARAASATAITTRSTCAAQARDLELREAALGLSMAMKDDAKSLSFVEDTAVAPERLRDYIERFLAIVREHGTSAGVYAHASVGCLHVRPVVNLKTEAGVRTVRGDRQRRRRSGARVRRRAVGRARRRPGAQPVHARRCSGRCSTRRSATSSGRSIPHGIFNPGKIVDAPPLTANLRYGAGYRDAAAGDVLRLLASTAAWPAPSRCAAASAPAARRSTARCARRTWRRARRRTRRAAAPTCCGWRWPAGSASRASATKACARCSISASSAAPARPSARSASTWRGSRASSSPTTGARHGTPLRARALGHVHELSRWGSRSRRFELRSRAARRRAGSTSGCSASIAAACRRRGRRRPSRAGSRGGAHGAAAPAGRAPLQRHVHELLQPGDRRWRAPTCSSRRAARSGWRRTAAAAGR